MMASFTYLENMIEGTLTPEQHNFIHTRYTKVRYGGDRQKGESRTSFLNSEMSIRSISKRNPYANLTVIGGCSGMRRSAVGLVAPKEFLDAAGPHLETVFKSKGLKLRMYETVDEFFNVVRHNLTSEFCFGFELSDIRPGVNEINVTYMYPLDASQNTYKPLYDLTQNMPDYWNWNSTFLYGTPQFMVYITDMIVMLLTGKRVHEIELAFIPMKTPEFNQLEPFASQQLTLIFPFFYMCIFLLPLYYMVSRLAEEKESKAREGMKMMGLREHTYFIGWFIFLFLIVSTMSTIIVGICAIDVLANSSLILVYLMSVLYGMTLFGFAFIVVALFPSKKGSATAASLIHLMSYYVAFVYQGYGSSFGQKLFAALVPNCALSFMVEHLFHCELDGAGMSFEFAAMQYQNFSFIWGLVMLLIDVVLYAFLSFYLDQIMPREIGIARPWNFPCKSKAKRKRIDVKIGKVQLDKNSKDLGDEKHANELVKQGNFEQVSEGLRRDHDALKVRGLKKVFSNGKEAVKGVDMTMYSGQIFALLGHNGAGKTTTISMLTGLLEHTSGQATVFGIDIFEDIDQLRENLGVCPQHNVLFDQLTVREHLELYASFKGVVETDIKKRVDKMILQIELSDVQNQAASTLSGGQKRKLSVGIALIGDSKIVMLDEPTSGMDTTTRRRFWEIMKQYKENRIVILTTHYMDEADILGDRICIMAEGKVQCCGTSLFLKKRFGVGYNLVIAKKDMQKAPQIDQFIKSKIPQVTKVQEVSSEISYQFPTEAQTKFKDFFNSLDKESDKLGINSYGVGITTLEEVFLRIGHGEDEGTTVEKIKKQTADVTKMSKRELELTEYTIADDHHRGFLSQTWALIKKRLLVAVRDRKSFIMDTLFPILLIFAGLYVSTLDLVPNLPQRSMSVYDFPQGRPLVYNHANFNQSSDVIEEFIERTMRNDIGSGKLFSEQRPIKVDTNDTFFNQCATVDDYLFDIKNEVGAQYGQFFFQQVDQDERFYAIAMFLNASSPISSISYAAYACQAVIRDLTENEKFKLTFAERPMPLSLRWQTYVNSATGVLCAISFAVAYMMVSDTLAQSLIKERQLKIKHQIIISGGSKLAYWVSNYIVDMLLHTIPAISGVLAIEMFEIDAPDMIWVFGWFIIVNPILIYAVSFLFDTDMKASVIIRICYFGFGAVAPISIIVLNVITKHTKIWGDWLEGYFHFIPIYNLGYSYLAIVNRRTLEIVMKLTKNSLQPLDWDCAGAQIYNLQCALIGSLSFLILAEIGLFQVLSRPFLKPLMMYMTFAFQMLRRKRKSKVFSIKDKEIEEDEEEEKLQQVKTEEIKKVDDTDPHSEELRCSTLKPRDCSILISKLTKSYVLRQKAVNNLSFGLEFGECFALLGVTGAGKTTTFKCLTGEEIPDEGDLFMGGYNVQSSLGFNKARCLIGYCPQFDAIFEHLTVREHLAFYATIKGVRRDLKSELIDKQIKEMDLVDYQHVQAGQLSGGNKRKLSCAMALIGNPPIVLLDEPSTGVDPQAKRFMWTIISNISTLRKKSTVILTTHSMEEAEALCTKMGIMVNGQFKCFGSSQHIKDKYGMGFEIEVKFEQLSHDQVQWQKRDFGYLVDFINEDGILPLLNKLNCAHLNDEIRADGLGSEIFKTLSKQNKVMIDEVLKWAHIQVNVTKFRKRLEKTFKEVQVMEYYSNAIKFKVSRDQYSIGFVFGLLEETKKPCQISEYSAMQTTLEQIFNMFARQANTIEDEQEVSALKKNA